MILAGASAFAFSKIGASFDAAGATNAAGVASGDIARSTLTEFGGNLLTTGQVVGQIASHAAVGGVTSVLMGGKFGHGFVSAGIVKGFSNALGKINGLMYKGKSLAQAGTAAVLGGTVSKISGGKFANGAITGAFQNLYNQQGGVKEKASSVDETKNTFGSFRVQVGKFFIKYDGGGFDLGFEHSGVGIDSDLNVKIGNTKLGGRTERCSFGVCAGTDKNGNALMSLKARVKRGMITLEGKITGRDPLDPNNGILKDSLPGPTMHRRECAAGLRNDC